MAQLVKWDEISLMGYLPGADPDILSIEASCVTGFETAAQAEVLDTLGIEATKHQGRVFFDIPFCDLDKVLKLRCVDNVWVLFGVWPKVDLDLSLEPQEECLDELNAILLPNLQWLKGLRAWNKIFKYFENENELSKVVENASYSKDPIPVEKTEDETESDRRLPSFRCTCYRTGENMHSFGSMDVARSVGGAIQDMFGWVVKMKNHDLEIVVNVDKDQIYCCIALTKESLFRRNIVSFGPTTLRATICASLLKLAQIEKGDVVVDPMCGGGSIPLEAALTYPGSIHLGGDMHEKAVERCFENLRNLNDNNSKSLPVDFFYWDVTSLPLKDNSVDVFVTDLPFGKRSGSKADNKVLYPKIMLSMARVVKPTTGRAVLLTQDKNSMFKCMGKFNKFWKNSRYLSCNIGGLTALVFLMQRTSEVPATVLQET